MTTRSEINLQKFLRRVTTKSAGNSKLSLCQITTSGGTNLLRDMLLDSDYGYDEERISEMVSELLSTAQEDADNHRGVTSFVVIAFKGVTRGERSPLFRLRSQDADFESSEALGETEPATKDGHLAQMMRHNETMMRLLVQQSEVLSNQSAGIIARLTSHNEKLEDKHFEVLARAEDLANESEERAQSRLLLASKEKRKDQLIATLKPLVPVLMAKFKGTPASAKPELFQDSIKAIMQDLTPEKMAKIAEILGPHSIALAEIWMDAHKDQDEEIPNEQTNSAGKTH